MTCQLFRWASSQFVSLLSFPGQHLGLGTSRSPSLIPPRPSEPLDRLLLISCPKPPPLSVCLRSCSPPIHFPRLGQRDPTEIPSTQYLHGVSASGTPGELATSFRSLSTSWSSGSCEKKGIGVVAAGPQRDPMFGASGRPPQLPGSGRTCCCPVGGRTFAPNCSHLLRASLPDFPRSQTRPGDCPPTPLL